MSHHRKEANVATIRFRTSSDRKGAVSATIHYRTSRDRKGAVRSFQRPILTNSDHPPSPEATANDQQRNPRSTQSENPAPPAPPARP